MAPSPKAKRWGGSGRGRQLRCSLRTRTQTHTAFASRPKKTPRSKATNPALPPTASGHRQGEKKWGTRQPRAPASRNTVPTDGSFGAK